MATMKELFQLRLKNRVARLTRLIALDAGNN